MSAQPAVDPETGKVDGDNITQQTQRVITNIANLLSDAGTSIDNAVKVTAILKDRSLFAEFNAAYSEFFPHDPPARTTLYSDTGTSLVLIDVTAGMK